MIAYTPTELSEGFSAVGLTDGDTVYLSTQLYGLGRMIGATDKDDFLSKIFTAICAAIGRNGTLVVPTFTQQVGRIGLTYIHERTATMAGIFGQYILCRKDAVRSLHPIFSVAAIGPKKHQVCDDISPVAFGADSTFDRLAKMGAKAVCVGFDYYSGHIVSLMHYVETRFGVPYYYNKIVEADAYIGARKLEQTFIINVKYLNIAVEFDYHRYIDALGTRNMVRSAPVGGGFIYEVDVADMVEVGLSELKQDLHSFLAHPPAYKVGEPPLDGPEYGKSEAST